MSTDRPDPIDASVIATSGAPRKMQQTAANRLARPALATAARRLRRDTAKIPLTRMLKQSRYSSSPFMRLETSLEIARRGENGEETQGPVNQRDVQIDGAADEMRVERDQRYRHHRQHVDGRNAINGGASQDQAQHAENNAKENQRGGGAEDDFTQKPSPGALQMGPRSGGYLHPDRSS